jgi:hypothetical protein
MRRGKKRPVRQPPEEQGGQREGKNAAERSHG